MKKNVTESGKRNLYSSWKSFWEKSCLSCVWQEELCVMKEEKCVTNGKFVC